MINNEQIFRGDIVWASNSLAKGKIQDKGRPYVIVSNNKANRYSDIITAVPLTTKHKNSLPTHYVFMVKGKTNVAMAEQIVCLNKADITEIIDTISDNDLAEIEKRVKIQLDLKGE